MSDDVFFFELAALAALPYYVKEFIKLKYKTRARFYKDIDAGGPYYSQQWEELGLKERQLERLREAALELREPDKSSCTVI